LPECIFDINKLSELDLTGNKFNRKFNKEYIVESEMIELKEYLISIKNKK
jgi:hypothetical protein